jgi:predicted Zn-dependent peptidase
LASIEEVISDLKKLTPEQVQQVASLVHGLAQPSPSYNDSKSDWAGIPGG